MITISKNHHIHKMSGSNPPCAFVAPNTTLTVETWDALKGKAKHYFEAQTPYSEIFPHANPATGPIYVEGAGPGDALEVKIHDIRLDSAGYITRKKSMISDSQKDSPTEHLEIRVTGDHFEFQGKKVSLPVEPMIGVIGTAPRPGMEMWCQEAGDHGSNMDTRIIRKGATLLLPVFVEGALLSLGDVHVVMGEGEVFGQGVEIGAEVDITVNVRKDVAIQRPVVLLEDRFVCIASHADIYAAKDAVIKDMGEYLIANYPLDADDAFALTAFYANLNICQIVNPQKTLRFELEYKYIDYFLSGTGESDGGIQSEVNG